MPLKDCDEKLIEQVLAAAIEIHRELGPGLLESVYEHALMIELKAAGIPAQDRWKFPLDTAGMSLIWGFERISLWLIACFLR